MKVNLDISETELLELVQGFLPKNLSISSVGIRAGHVEIAGKLKKFLMWHGFRAGLDLRLADNGKTMSIKLISVKALMMEGLPTKLLKNALSSAFSNGKIPGVSYSHEDACVKITFAKLRLPRCITSGVLSELKLMDGVSLCFESSQMPLGGDVSGEIQAKNADFACGVREPTDWPCECTLVGVHCGKTVCAESAGRRPLAASRDAYGGDREEFTIIRNDDGSFSIKAAVNGKYVSVMPNKGGRLLAQGEKVDLWEKFDLRKVEGETGFYTLWSHVAKKYVSVDENKGNVLIANRDSPDNWEWFCLRHLSGDVWID